MKRIVLISVLAMSQMGATDCGQINKDPGFDLWCGDRLCDWKIEQGDARRVSTWHEGDDGVELVGGDVLITQQTAVDSGDGTCIEFSMLTDVALDADVKLEFDVFGDGTVDYTQTIPTAHWEPVSYLVSIPSPYNGIEFRLSKHGAGHAVLAEITARTRATSDCNGLVPIVLPPSPDGAWCGAFENVCASGLCANPIVPQPALIFPPAVCDACATNNDCTGAATVCGVDDAVGFWLYPYRACVPAASRNVGELCIGDAECASGICENGACSMCHSNCLTGGNCVVADTPVPLPNGGTIAPPTMPKVCAALPSSSACFRDGDCTSGHCNGGQPVKVCAGDGRSCNLDLDCPMDDKLVHKACVAIGITGGTCQ
jgi:hypothetical protein